MQRKKLLIFGLLVMLVIAVVFLCGCNMQPTSNLGDAGTELKTCAELNGYECDVGEDCEGEWLDASDSFRCCSCECESSVNEEDLLTIDLFEESPENEDLGDIYD